MRRSTLLLFLAVPTAFLAAVVLSVVFHAQHTLNRQSLTAATLGQLQYSLKPLDLRQQPGGFQPVASRDAFTHGAVLHGELCLAGPGGLTIYAANGSARRTLHTGIELPTAPITALATARLRGAPGDQLLIATAGAGLLLLDSDPRGGIALTQLQPSAPQAGDLTALLPLSTGDLLLGTRHAGVLRFSGAALSPLHFSLPGLESDRLEVTSLAAAGPALLLIGTRSVGLIALRGGVAQHLESTTGLPDDDIESIVTAGSVAFVATPLGVARLETEAPSLRVTRLLAPGVFSHALVFDPITSRLSIGSLGQSVLDLPLGPAFSSHPRIRTAAYELPVAGTHIGSVSQFIAGSSSTYAIVDGTLLIRSAAGWTDALPSLPAPTLSDRNISALAFDSVGDLYVGFFDRGLDIVPAQPNAPIRHLEDDHLFCLNRLALDPARGTIAAATANGLVLFDRAGTPRQVFTRHDGLISDHITDIAFTPTGTTVATPAGLTFISPTGTESLYAFQGLVNNHVYTLASPGPGTLLAGTLGGLSVLQSRSVQRNFTAANSGLRHNWITALLPLPGGDALLGTYGAGLLRFSNQPGTPIRFTPADLPATLPHDLVINPNALFATPSRILAGTLGHGMLVYRVAEGRWISVTQGLPSLNVTAFAERAGTLYIGTENGLVSIAEDRLP